MVLWALISDEISFEEDDSWLDILKVVKPDLSLSHWPEYATKTWIRGQQRGKYKQVFKVLLRRIGINPSETRKMFLVRKIRG